MSKYSSLKGLIELDCDVDLSLKFIARQLCTHFIITGSNRGTLEIERLSEA